MIENEEPRQISLVKLVHVLGALPAFNSMSIDMYLPAFPRITQDLSAASLFFVRYPVRS